MVRTGMRLRFEEVLSRPKPRKSKITKRQTPGLSLGRMRRLPVFQETMLLRNQLPRLFDRYKRETAAAFAFVLLVLLVSIASPSFLNFSNVRDLCMNNVSVLLVAVGVTLVMLVGQIDISV